MSPRAISIFHLSGLLKENMAEASAEIRQKIQTIDGRFQRACDQIVILNRHLDNLQLRYDRAHRDNLRTFRYSLRIKLSATEGVRNMFVEYASAVADELMELQCQLLEQANITSDDTDEWDEDDDFSDEDDDDDDIQ